MNNNVYHSNHNIVLKEQQRYAEILSKSFCDFTVLFPYNAIHFIQIKTFET